MARITKNRSSMSFQSSDVTIFKQTTMAVIASSSMMEERRYYGETVPAGTSTRHNDGSVSNTLARVILKPNGDRI